MTEKPVFAAAIHDVQARLGSIRIAVTAVAGLDLDAETRNEMLTSASEESVRASAELAALGALASCLLDHAEPVARDVVAAARDAAAAAQIAGLDVDVDVDVASTAMATCAPQLDAVLVALIRIVADAGTDVAVAVHAHAGRVNVRMTRAAATDADAALPKVVGFLLEALGATREASPSGLAFSFAGGAQ